MDKTIEAQRAIVAERIMLWEPCGDGWMSRERVYSTDIHWRPDTNIVQAMMLAEAMRQSKWHVQIDLPTRGQVTCMASWNWAKTKDIEVFYSHADKLEQAIFDVAVQVANREFQSSSDPKTGCEMIDVRLASYAAEIKRLQNKLNSTWITCRDCGEFVRMCELEDKE